tara:strand:- start:111 stop:1301 length:1191 start_codon:yes stop_codon:yes gene_type:complete
MKTKVLYVHHGFGVGGAPISLINLINSLDQNTYDVKVLCLRDSVVVDLFKKNNIQVEVYPSNTNWFIHNKSGSYSPLFFFKYWNVYRSWKKVAHQEAKEYFQKNEKFDIVHLNSHVLSSWAYAAKKQAYKVVLHNREAVYRGYFGFRYGILRRLINDNCDRVINISQDNMDRLGLDDKSVVIYNSIKIPDSSELNYENSGPTLKVLYLGGASKIKGYKIISQALKYLKPNVLIEFAGNYPVFQAAEGIKGQLKFQLKKLLFFGKYQSFKEISSSRNAKLTGFSEDPMKSLKGSDLLVSPFVEPHFSRPAIEAFSLGKPVVASDIEGMREIVDHNENGFLYPYNSAQELANTLNRIAEDKSILIEMGKKGRLKAEELYSADRNARMVESVYQELMES